MSEVLLRGGTLVDGTGREGFRGDVLVRGERIAAVGASTDSDAVVIDVGGLVVAPGFIDCHSHSDGALFDDPLATPKVAQGVTLEIVGNCGFGTFPIRTQAAHDAMGALLSREGKQWDFASLAEYRQALQQRGIALNAATHAPHGAIRTSVVGGEDRSATEAELQQMRALLREALAQGAVGLSFGLLYAPGCFTPTEELVALGELAAEFGRPLVFHVRDEGERCQESIREAIEVGRRAKASVQISHLKITDPKQWGQVGTILALLEEANARGQQVTCDQYPYTAGSTVFTTMLPPWALEGGTRGLVADLKDEAFRQRLLAALLSTDHVQGYQSMANRRGAEGAQVGWAPGWEAVEGKTLAEIATETRQSPAEALIELLVRTQAKAIGIYHSMREDDVRTVMSHPLQMVGSDGIPSPGKPHPRLWGTFPRVLGEYVRELGLLSLEQAVHKMTGRPAATFGLTDRGRLAPGCFADICVFDPASLRDRSTWTEPTLPPEGIVHVLCNGQFTLREGQRTEQLPGRMV